MRADKLLKEIFPELSNRLIEEAFKKGWVTFQGRKCKKGDFLSEKKDLEFGKVRTQIDLIRAGNSSLSVDIVFENPDFWVVDKPAGIPGHTLSFDDQQTLTQWALAQETLKKDDFLQFPPEVSPHRLDTGTSGLLIVCKNQASFKEWRDRFQEKKVTKGYLAWCFGEVKESELEIETEVAHAKSDPSKIVVVGDSRDYRPPILLAKSRIKLIKTAQEGLSLWDIRCETGVTHQVRVQMASLGLPLVGDRQYDPYFEKRGIQPAWHLLRAYSLESGEFHWELPSFEFRELF